MYTITVRASGQGNATTSAAMRALSGSGGFAYLGYLPLVLGGLWALL